MTKLLHFIRPVLGLVALLGASVVAQAAGGGAALLHSGADINNKGSLQRGARHFMNYCVGCHSASYVRYNRLAKDLDLTEEQVMENLAFTLNPKTGEPVKPGEQIVSAMSAKMGEAMFGKAPPDLTMTARYKHGGADWIYSYLLGFYPDATRPIGWNNKYFAGASMPHVLWEYSGIQEPIIKKSKTADGADHSEITGFKPVSAGKLSPAEYQTMARDISAFMLYIAEPAALQRRELGIWVLFYMLVLCGVTYLLKHEYWKDVH
jgi:ubiquinol-cytochrome c reductase cytochrome c1 subunit